MLGWEILSGEILRDPWGKWGGSAGLGFASPSRPRKSWPTRHLIVYWCGDCPTTDTACVRLALVPVLNVTRGTLAVATSLVEVSISGFCHIRWSSRGRR